MPADVAQEVDVIERVQPVGIVRHHRIILAVAEPQEAREDFANAFQVAVDDIVGEQPPALILAGGVADTGGAAAHQRDRTMAGLLHPMQHHDRQQRADMKGRGGAVEADIGRDRRLARERVQCLGLRDLVNEAPGGENVKEIGLVGAHYNSSDRTAVRGAAGVTGPGRDSTADAVVGMGVPIMKKAAIACDGGFQCRARNGRTAYFAAACFSGSLTASNVANSTAQGRPSAFFSTLRI